MHAILDPYLPIQGSLNVGNLRIYPYSCENHQAHLYESKKLELYACGMVKKYETHSHYHYYSRSAMNFDKNSFLAIAPLALFPSSHNGIVNTHTNKNNDPNI
jgi:hypothetical protein